MRRLLTIIAMTGVFSALALAETWTGRLVDSTCMKQQPNSESTQEKESACNPTNASTNFALIAQGRTYELNPAGNEKVQTALKSRAEREKNPNQTENAPVTAKVTGTMQGDTIDVESIRIE